MRTILKNFREWFADWMCHREWFIEYLQNHAGKDSIFQRIASAMGLKGKFLVEIIRNGVVIAAMSVPNGITDEGLNNILDVEFNSATQITTWYIGLVDNASFSAFAAADTMASHAGWIEVTAYSESVRQTWGSGAASARSVTNATAATFSINATKTLKGIFVTSDNTKSGTTGKLWSTAAFASTVAVISGDSVKVTYTVSG